MKLSRFPDFETSAHPRPALPFVSGAWTILLIIIGAVLFMLSFPNFIVKNGVQGLGAVSIAPVLFAAAGCKKKRTAYAAGAMFGVASTCLAYFWLSRFQEYSVWTIGGASFGYALEYGIVFVVLHFISRAFSYRSQALYMAIAWSTYEYLKSIGFLGFSWTILAQSVHNVQPLIQLVRITGIWGLSFLLAWCNGLIYATVRTLIHTQRVKFWHGAQLANNLSASSKNGDTDNADDENASHPTVARKTVFGGLIGSSNMPASLAAQWLLLAMCTTGALAYGWHSIANSSHRPVDDYVPVLLIQQNVDSWEYQNTDGVVNNLEKIIAQTKTALDARTEKPKLIVWSETSLALPYQPGLSSDWDSLYENRPSSLSFKDFLKQNNIPLLTGSVHMNPEDTAIVYNSALLINPNGDVDGMYYKHQLVPFAERVPFYSLPFVRKLMSTIGISGTWSQGEGPHKIIKMNNYNGAGDDLYIGTPICFEDSFPYITRAMVKSGAGMLVNLTNVSWSKSESAQVQQLAAAKFRSIETGVPLVRGTNSGITSLVNPWGRVVKQAPMFTPATLEVNVPIYKNNTTVYMIIGDSFAYIMVISTLIILFAGTRRIKRHVPFD